MPKKFSKEHFLGAQLTALPAVNRIAAPVMKPGLGNLGGDGRKRLAVRAGSVNSQRHLPGGI